MVSLMVQIQWHLKRNFSEGRRGRKKGQPSVRAWERTWPSQPAAQRASTMYLSLAASISCVSSLKEDCEEFVWSHQSQQSSHVGWVTGCQTSLSKHVWMSALGSSTITCLTATIRFAASYLWACLCDYIPKPTAMEVLLQNLCGEMLKPPGKLL